MGMRSRGPLGVTYEEYIASPRWRVLRGEALARDGYRCRGCGATDRLEVHHVRYGDPLGTETVDDLTTLCGGPTGCHHAITEAIRRRRYVRRAHPLTPSVRIAPGAQETGHAEQLPAFEFQAHRRLTPGHAQRPVGEPAGPHDEGT